jgi:uncharacterized protein CbrC (UPF0167 family)
VATVPGDWLAHLDEREAWQLGRLADRLPTLVYWHSVGVGLEEMLARAGGWSTWRFERALDVACGCIAAYLNRAGNEDTG